jgi:hypothetical protein
VRNVRAARSTVNLPKLPRLIPPAKAPHRARGSDVAGVCSAIAAVVFGLLFSPTIAALAALMTAPLSAFIAGVLVKRVQERQNLVAAAHGSLTPLHSVDSLDAWATLRGGVPVALPMIVLLLLILAD